MAITITSPSNANLTDSSTSISVSVSGKTSGSLISANLSVHGQTIASGSTTSSSLTLTYSKSDLYSALNGKSLSNAVKLTVSETKDDAPLGFKTLEGGKVTITARLSNQSWGSMANPYNLDNPTQIITTWSRPHSAFRARVKVYVNGVLVINRYNFTTSIAYTPTSTQINNMIAAMKGVSPRPLKIEVITQFNSSSVIDLESTGMSLTRSAGVVKSFAERSTISSFANFTVGNAINYTIAQATPGTTHDVTLKIGSTTILTRSNVGTGARTITPTEAEISTMYTVMGSVTSATATLSLVTKLSGSQVGSTHSRTATATVGANVIPDFDLITHSELTTNPDVASLVGAYVQSISNLSLAITGAVPGRGATIAAYQITISKGSTVLTTINKSSGSTGVVSYYGSGLVLKGRVTDSRGRVKEKSVNIDILPYKPPKVAGLEFYRCDEDGVENPIGTHVKFLINASASSLVVDGVEKNTLSISCKTRPTDSTTEKVEQIIQPPGLVYDGESDIFSGYVITTGYDGWITVTDLFFTTVAVGSVASGILMAWGKTGVGIGKLPEEGRALDVAGDIYVNGEKLSACGQIVEDNLHESSPTNGYYIRYSNGTQICWSDDLTGINIENAAGSIYRSGYRTWTFPAPFINDKYFCSAEVVSTVYAWGGAQSYSASACRVLGFSYTGMPDVTMRAIAIGRYK